MQNEHEGLDQPSDTEVYRGLIQQASLLPDENVMGMKLFSTEFRAQPWPTNMHFTNRKIGRIAEEAFAHYIRDSARYKLLAEQIVIDDQGITKGELDFLLHDTMHDRSIHVELACKFYLYDPQIGQGIEGWIGPNRNDLLKDKLLRLKNHQLPLLGLKETQEALVPLGLDINQIDQSVCLMGFLFTPVGQPITARMEVNPEALAGHYISRHMLEERLTDTDEVCWIPKPKWPALPNDAVSWNFWAAMKHDVLAQLDEKKSVMLWIRRKKAQPERIFVVWW